MKKVILPLALCLATQAAHANVFVKAFGSYSYMYTKSMKEIDIDDATYDHTTPTEDRYDPEFGGGVAVGYAFNNVPIDLMFVYQKLGSADFNVTKNYLVSAGDYAPVAYKATVNSDFYLAALNYRFKGYNQLEPFVGIQMGLADLKVEGTFSDLSSGGYGDWDKTTEKNFAIGAQVGFLYRFTDWFSLSSQLNYLHFGKAETRKTVDIIANTPRVETGSYIKLDNMSYLGAQLDFRVDFDWF